MVVEAEPFGKGTRLEEMVRLYKVLAGLPCLGGSLIDAAERDASRSGT